MALTQSLDQLEEKVLLAVAELIRTDQARIQNYAAIVDVKQTIGVLKYRHSICRVDDFKTVMRANLQKKEQEKLELMEKDGDLQSLTLCKFPPVQASFDRLYTKCKAVLDPAVGSLIPMVCRHFFFAPPDIAFEHLGFIVQQLIPADRFRAHVVSAKIKWHPSYNGLLFPAGEYPA